MKGQKLYSRISSNMLPYMHDFFVLNVYVLLHLEHFSRSFKNETSMFLMHYVLYKLNTKRMVGSLLYNQLFVITKDIMATIEKSAFFY